MKAPVAYSKTRNSKDGRSVLEAGRSGKRRQADAGRRAQHECRIESRLDAGPAGRRQLARRNALRLCRDSGRARGTQRCGQRNQHSTSPATDVASHDFSFRFRAFRSPLRVDAQHSAAVVAHPQRSKADGQPHGRPSQPQPADDPLRARVDPHDLPRVEVGHPHRTEADGDSDRRRRPRDCSGRPVRPAVDAHDRASAVAARRPDRAPAGRQERTRLPARAELVATTVFVPGSMRTMLSALGRLTQTAPAPAATAMWSEQHACADPIRTVATTLFVAGSILETLGPPLFTTQTAPGVVAIPSGCGPTGIVAASELSCGSIRRTTVVGHACDPERAVAGRGLSAAPRQVRAGDLRRDAGAGDNGVRRRVDPHQDRHRIAGRPDRSLPHGESPRVRGDRDLRPRPCRPSDARRAGPQSRALRLRRRWQLTNATSAVMRTRLVVFMLPPSSRDCVSTRRSKHPSELVPSGITLGSAQVEGKP